MRTSMVALLATLVSPQSLSAKPAVMTLAELIDDSDRIVVAEVESVNWSIAIGGRYATAKVLETWKGPPTDRVVYAVSPQNSCDESAAIVGEKVVLCLRKERLSRFLAVDSVFVYSIAFDGRGRLPVRDVDGEPSVSLSWTITPPAGLVNRARIGTLQLVKLSDVRSLVQNAPGRRRPNTRALGNGRRLGQPDRFDVFKIEAVSIRLLAVLAIALGVRSFVKKMRRASSPGQARNRPEIE
jgi:hypothetical protein